MAFKISIQRFNIANVRNIIYRNQKFTNIGNRNTLALIHRWYHSNVSSDDRKTDFGYQNINKNDKEQKVKEIFNKVAEKYDLMNDLMSFGAHRLWKDEFMNMINISSIARINPKYIPKHLDVAGGTGDIAFRSLQQIRRLYNNGVIQETVNSNTSTTNDSDKNIVICDINSEMLKVGKQRAMKQFNSRDLDLLGFVEGNAEILPFADETFDIYTIAFGLRNVTNKDKAIREAYRVLKKGGRMLILEFSHINESAGFLKPIYDQFSFNVIPCMGQIVANDADSYKYLVESIRRFPKQDELIGMMIKEGFVCTNYVNFTFGVVAVHSGYKL